VGLRRERGHWLHGSATLPLSNRRTSQERGSASRQERRVRTPLLTRADATARSRSTTRTPVNGPEHGRRGAQLRFGLAVAGRLPISYVRQASARTFLHRLAKRSQTAEGGPPETKRATAAPTAVVVDARVRELIRELHIVGFRLNGHEAPWPSSRVRRSSSRPETWQPQRDSPRWRLRFR